MWTEKNPTRLGGSFLYGPLASFLLSIVTVGRLGASCGAMSVVARDFMEGSMVSVSCKQLCVSLRTQPDSRIKAGTP